ncbi:MAG: hypothetical protein PHC66_01420 [Candidatus Nanoarchaeia archaeon]|nr:hypothetical protein [Candidatus Nanoarchaeia archaeon]MDD5239182.1 hypothetical protein [Candidatus Nanoarchaeia archaeon]
MFPEKVPTLQMLQDLLYRGGESEEKYVPKPPSLLEGYEEVPFCVGEHDKNGFLIFRDPTPEEMAAYHKKE